MCSSKIPTCVHVFANVHICVLYVSNSVRTPSSVIDICMQIYLYEQLTYLLTALCQRKHSVTQFWQPRSKIDLLKLLPNRDVRSDDIRRLL